MSREEITSVVIGVAFVSALELVTFKRYELYKSTFYLLTFLLIWVSP